MGPGEKLFLGVSDSASNILKALNGMDIISISCFGHDINLVFVFGYERSVVIIALRNKLCEIVTLTRQSGSARRLLKECQKILGMKNFLMLISHVATRWNR